MFEFEIFAVKGLELVFLEAVSLPLLQQLILKNGVVFLRLWHFLRLSRHWPAFRRLAFSSKSAENAKTGALGSAETMGWASFLGLS